VASDALISAPRSRKKGFTQYDTFKTYKPEEHTNTYTSASATLQLPVFSAISGWFFSIISTYPEEHINDILL